MSPPIQIRGVSAAAQYIKNATQEDRDFLHQSSVFGIESMLRIELAEAWEECQEPGWDGHEAQAVTQDALRTMYTFLEALPLGFSRPTIGADPYGHLSVEWYKSPHRVLSVGVAPDEVLHYAAILGSNRTCGTETFFGDIPESILNLVRRVYS